MNKIFVLELAQEVCDLDGFASLVLVESADVNAGDHFIHICHGVEVNKYFSVSLLKVQNLLDVRVETGVRRLHRHHLLRIPKLLLRWITLVHKLWHLLLILLLELVWVLSVALVGEALHCDV